MTSAEGSSSARSKVVQIINEEFTRSLQDRDGGMKLIGLNLSTLPVEVIDMIRDSTERLSLQNNAITSLSQQFRKLSYLRYLDIHDNKLNTFPEVLTTMERLEVLDISDNQISELPSDFGNLEYTLRVFLLKNNKIEILSKSLIRLNNLKILEIDANPIRHPPTSFMNSIAHKTQTTDWIMSLKNYLLNNDTSHLYESYDKSHVHSPYQLAPPPPISNPQQKVTPHLERSKSTSEGYVSSRAAKRMGFIIKRANGDLTNDTIQENEPIRPIPEFQPLKTLDPFKRNRSLSTTTVPHDRYEENKANTEERYGRSSTHNARSRANSTSSPSPIGSDHLDFVSEPRSNDYFKRLSTLPEKRFNLSQFKIVEVSKKILFAFSEFQSTIKKLNSFCSEKSIVIEMVSQLYYSKTVIDHLVEGLEKNEESDQNVVSTDDILKAVSQTISVFKRMIDLLQSNYQTYIRDADVCFIRMLLLSLFGSYAEVFNAYKILIPDVATRPGKEIYTNSSTINNTSHRVPPQLPSLRIPELNGSSSTITQQQLNEYNEVDDKLYASLATVLQTSSLVYSQLNEAISKGAIATAMSSSEGQKSLNGSTISKIKELTNTCVVSIDLDKKIKQKLSNDNVKSLGILEKKKFYDEVNALLKSIITILGLTKDIMNYLPILNEVRPSLANLTKATKDVTIMLEVSSYRLINDSFSNSSSVPQSSTTMQPPMLSSIPSVMSIPQMNTPFLPSNLPTAQALHTPSLATHTNVNPFEMTLTPNLNNEADNNK